VAFEVKEKQVISNIVKIRFIMYYINLGF